MLAFEVFIDDQRVCLAGFDDWAVLSAIISAVQRREPMPGARDEIELSVGGLSETDASGVSHHLRWVRTELQVGTKVTVNIVETDRPDEPVRRYRSDREVQESPFTDEEIEEMERADWLRLKPKFESDDKDTA
jgi:hypothetical protein